MSRLLARIRAAITEAPDEIQPFAVCSRCDVEYLSKQDWQALSFSGVFQTERGGCRELFENRSCSCGELIAASLGTTDSVLDVVRLALVRSSDLESALGEVQARCTELVGLLREVERDKARLEEERALLDRRVRMLERESYRQSLSLVSDEDTVEKEAKRREAFSRFVIVESPYAAASPEGIEANLRYARRCMRDCFDRGEIPFASHLLYTQEGILDDTIPEERSLGMNAGFALREIAARTVVYVDRGVSGGMRDGMTDAARKGRSVQIRRIDGVPTSEPMRVSAISVVPNAAEIEARPGLGYCPMTSARSWVSVRRRNEPPPRARRT